ncbi:MAG: hypothetical protein UU37_C0001G0029 [Candidatus Gottesmanbacteria bacterium GW2011_GWA2_41_12]|uniref:Uncharacterized protein n=2 Tax=Candidatus Gottesmaniibacteriota TaxID=1752720 RepID=A0A0G0WW20_9BACT|nr:MAG: hypothetical protein UT63_C0005G0013 [Candidatus Gottesmanbacteria bacterium GW2011_GWC2_39_8]KKR88610.1 MAG: hypothetical protein UU37_C0001G0029 [Candidatus Gottesmanbacteria bacterium GW2011_GWA2_41_12]
MKKLIGLVGGIAMLAAASGPVLAADCEILTTGPSSTNRCRLSAKKKIDYKVNNKSTVSKTQVTTADTGTNTQNGNTVVTGGGVESGAVKANGTAELDANSVVLDVDQSAASGPSTGLVDTTGPKSTNKVKVVADKKVTLDVKNDSSITVTQVTTANSGHNSMNGNTVTSGTVYSGDAEANSTSKVFANYTEITVVQ